ncbi:tautomerase family protein [Fusobacterium polymorphum]|uniref:tautomerase family protein n=1 Tax=Fusobacterium nucleatum subsp. polymorphum TaxID=76857 RepID=UPI001C9CAD49|nr:tautomerase family protein [Fusobacterium polymorphum]
MFQKRRKNYASDYNGIRKSVNRTKKRVSKELVTKVTELTAGVTGVPKEAFIVLIKENDAESTGLGGELLSDKRAKMAAEKK